MFRPNTGHSQQSVLGTTSWMNPKVAEKLKKTWAHFFYEDVFLQIDEEPFAVIFANKGRPNFPLNILLCLEFIKHQRNCSDKEILDAFHFDFLVNHALGIRNLGEINLSERTLYYYRKRVYQYCKDHPDLEDMLFGQFEKLVEEFAAKAEISLQEQRVDTTMFTSNIKKAGRIALTHDVLVMAVKALPQDALLESLAKVLEPGFKNDILYRAKASEGDRRLETLLALCSEAQQQLETLPESVAVDERRVLARFIEEQTVWDEAAGKRIPRPKAEISSGSLQSAYDEDATFRRKGDKAQSGYVLGIAETCDPKNPFQLITEAVVAPNNISDQEILEEMIPRLKESGCTEVYLDGGFQSETTYQIASENGIEMHRTNMSGTEPQKRLPVSDFTIHEDTYIIERCPMGHEPTRVAVSKGQTIAHFDHQVCAHCELRDRCHSKAQKKDCVVRISITAIKTSRERQRMKAHRVKNTSRRAGIEGSNSALKRKGLAKLPVRGGLKCAIMSGLKVMAQNISRFITFRLGGYAEKAKKARAKGSLRPNLASGT